MHSKKVDNLQLMFFLDRLNKINLILQIYFDLSEILGVCPSLARILTRELC